MSALYPHVPDHIRAKAKAELPPTFSLDLANPELVDFWGTQLTSISYTNIMLKGICLLGQCKLSANAILIYLVLLFMSYGKDEVTFEHKQIMLITGMPRRNFARGLVELIEAGFIAISENSRSHTNKTYKILVDIRKDQTAGLNPMTANIIIGYPELYEYFEDSANAKKLGSTLTSTIKETVEKYANEEEKKRLSETYDEIYFKEHLDEFPDYEDEDNVTDEEEENF